MKHPTRSLLISGALYTLVAFGFARSTQSELIVVPRDVPTIKAGFDLSAEGDTVLVQPGTYPERIVFPAHEISLISLRGPEMTIIDGENAGTVVRFDPGDHQSTLLEGFTIRRGSAMNGGGIRVVGASPAIRGNIISGNLATGDGGGIWVESGGAPWIVGNRIDGNISDDDGAGLWFYYAGAALVEGNEIINNWSESAAGGIGATGTDSLVLLENRIEYNVATSRGAVYLGSCVRPRIEGGSVSWNQSRGVYLSWCESAELRSVDIVGNSSASYGGGIYVYDYRRDEYSRIVGCRVVGNSASSRGGGIYKSFGGGSIEHCTVAGNTVDDPAGQGAGIYWYQPDSTAAILGSIIAGNEPDGIYGYDYYDETEISLIRNLMWNHTGGHYDNVRPGRWDVLADPLPIAPDSLDWRPRADSPAIDAGLPEWEVPEGGGALADIGADEAVFPDGGAVSVVLDSVSAEIRDDSPLRIAARVVNRTNRRLDTRLHLALTGVGGTTVAFDSLVSVPRFGSLWTEATADIPLRIYSGPASVTARALVDRPPDADPLLLAGDAVATTLAHVGDTLRVPDDAATIGEAIAWAEDGDLVLVSAGTWFERIDFDGKAIRVVGAEGPSACVIDAERAGTAIVFHHLEDSLSVIEGFTITGGYGNDWRDMGGGMRIEHGCSPIVRDLWFVENETTGSGGGVLLEGGSPRFERCLFSRNIAVGFGGGVAVVGETAHPRITSCTFYKNVAEDEGGAITLADGNATLEGSILLANSGYGAVAHPPLLLLQGSDNVYWANDPAERGPSLIPANRLPGDRDVDPGLRDPAAGDFRPLPVSPVVNAGPAALDPGLDGGPRIDVGAFELPYPLSAPIEVSLISELPQLVGGAEFEWSYQLISRFYATNEYDIFPSIIGRGWPNLAELDSDHTLLAPGDTLRIDRSDLLPDIFPTGTAILRLQVLDAAGDPVAAAVADADFQHIPRALHVPADHPSVEAAIETALHSDTIVVGPGTWHEVLRPGNRQIVLRSTFGPEATVIDGGGDGPVLLLNEGQDSTTVIEGLTFSGGVADAGGGVTLGGTSPVLRNVIVKKSSALPAPAPGYELGPETSTLAEEVRGHGGGLLVAEGAPRIIGSELRGNDADVGGGLSVFNGSLMLDRTRIARNSALLGGGGIYIGTEALLVATERSVIDSNAVPWPMRGSRAEGFDLLSIPAPPGDIRPNTGTPRHAGGIWIEGEAFMADALVRANQAWIHSEAGIEVAGEGSLFLDRSEVSANGGDGIAVERNGTLTLYEVLCSDNTGNGVFAEGTLDIDRSWFLRNGDDGLNFRYYTQADIRRSTLVGNLGAGLYAWGSDVDGVMTSTLIVANGMGVSGYYSWPQLDYRYNNVWGNDVDYYWSNPGPTDISVDPLFLDEAAEDYRIMPTSPLLDAGDPEIDLDPDSTLSEIGAGWIDQSSGLVLTATPQESTYFPGVTARVIHRLTDLAGDGWAVELERSIEDPGQQLHSLEPIAVDVPAGGSIAVEDSMIVPPNVPLGRYLYGVEVEGLARDEREVWVK
ncbi:MAG: hypothetical protein CME06_14280 [Gemmatimonadetes bacterium]|nr:hypothetical protein [Gemmatimonadota bacterium]